MGKFLSNFNTCHGDFPTHIFLISTTGKLNVHLKSILKGTYVS